MALGCNELITEVKAAVGRSTDTVQITDARVLRWLNKAQEEIAEQCPGLTALDMKNTVSVDFTTTLSYSLSEFTSHLSDVTTENRICHIYNAWFLNGADSVRLKFKPLDEFDADYPDPTSDDHEQNIPEYYTRRGNNIEVFPLPSSDWVDYDFRLDGSVYPIDFTTDSTSASSLERADDLLIAYGVFKAWSYIGGETGKANALAWYNLFESLLADYKKKNDVMHEWEANIYGPYI
jgi:hypothetical protein